MAIVRGLGSKKKKIEVESSKSWMPTRLTCSVPLYPIAFTNICKDKNTHTFTYNEIRVEPNRIYMQMKQYKIGALYARARVYAKLG